MTTYVTFNTTTGRISQILDVASADYIANNAADGEDLLVVPSSIIDIQFATHYVSDPSGSPAIAERGDLNTVVSWDNQTIDPDGVDTATLSSVPNPSNYSIWDQDGVGIDPTDGTITDGSFVTSCNVETVYVVEIDAVAYQVEQYLIAAGNIIAVQLMTINTTFNDPNTAEIIFMDLATVAVSTQTATLKEDTLLSVDLMTVVITNNSVTAQTIDTVSVDLMTIEVTMQPDVQVSENASIAIDLMTIAVTTQTATPQQIERIAIDLMTIAVTTQDIDIDEGLPLSVGLMIVTTTMNAVTITEV